MKCKLCVILLLFIIIFTFLGCNELSDSLSEESLKKDIQTSEPEYDLRGEWIFNANGYIFLLDLKVKHNNILGTLSALNHNDPISSIEGKIDGKKIQFYRSRGSREEYQEYEGYVFNGGIQMAGIFIHEKRNKGGWYAEKLSYPRQ